MFEFPQPRICGDAISGQAFVEHDGGWAFTIGPFAESERVSFVSLQVRRQGADPSKEPSLVEGSSGCAVGSPPGPLMEADKEVVGLSL